MKKTAVRVLPIYHSTKFNFEGYYRNNFLVYIKDGTKILDTDFLNIQYKIIAVKIPDSVTEIKGDYQPNVMFICSKKSYAKKYA